MVDTTSVSKELGSPSPRRFVKRIVAVVSLVGALLAVVVVTVLSHDLAVPASPRTLRAADVSDKGAPGRRARVPARSPVSQRTRKPSRPSAPPAVRWRSSAALGRPDAGRLVRGVKLPSEGEHFLTWDPVRREAPNRWWRRYATDRLVRMVLRVLDDFASEHPDGSRVVVGDLSRPRGGDFGRRFGPIGHASHQNGLDVDVYYPRRDRRERPPSGAGDVDLALAQDLVDRFVRAGAHRVFVGPGTGLDGPASVVQPLPNHDDHLHVRLPSPGAG